MKMAGLTQLATEGIEQLDLYYSSYLPQFFYAMLSPLLLFGICVFINWRVAAVLLGLRAADSGVHRGGVPLCKAHIRQILGQIHRHGRRVFRQRAGG